MNLMEFGARSMDLVDLEFSELGCLAEKNWSEAIFFESGAAWSPPKHALSLVNLYLVSKQGPLLPKIFIRHPKLSWLR
jgi:hypothetical protein